MITGWKTLLFNSILIVIGALQTLDWVHLIPNNPQITGAIITVLGVIGAIIRTLTNTDVTKSTSKAPYPEGFIPPNYKG